MFSQMVTILNVVLMLVIVPVQADDGVLPSAAEQRALAVIVGDDALADNVLEVCDRNAKLSNPDQYKALLRWVLPSAVRDSWRVTSKFQDGDIIAPADNLVTLADELGELANLRKRVANCSTRTRFDRRCQLALLAMIDVCDGKTNAAGKNLDQLFELTDPQWVGHAEHLPETLAVLRASDEPNMRRVLVDYVSQVAARFMGQAERNAWQLQIWAVYSSQKMSEYRPADELRDATELSQWLPVSRVTARTHGDGNPVARWGVSNGRGDILSSHNRDYLYFRSPLQGNFSVEADVTSFGYRGTHLSYADTEIIPVYNLRDYALCRFRSQEKRIPLGSELAKPKEWFRYRLEVRDGVATASFNGRQIPSRDFAPNSDSWLSICSPVRFNGSVRNLRITGEPVIPDRIALARSPELSGWYGYFEHDVKYDNATFASTERPVATWCWKFDADSPRGGIIGQRRNDLPKGCHNESLIRYHRPIVEDGVVEYEFFHDEQVAEAHPTIGRLAFLIRPGGVQGHWITDGPFEQSSLSPDNIFDLDAGPSAPIQLKNRAWNRVRLAVTDEKVDLSVNGNSVCTHQLAPEHERTFGLLHFSDRTELRVRDISWKGEWPKIFPAIADQELAGETTETLDAGLQTLAVEFEHDFVKDGVPAVDFVTRRGVLGKHFQLEPAGLRAACRGVGRYQDATLATTFGVVGDFDIAVRFEQLATKCAEGDSSTAALRLAFADDAETRCSLRRCRTRDGQTPLKPIIRCVHEFQKNLTEQKTHKRIADVARDVCECASGVLRMARRGNRLYYLLAEGTSDYFRVMGVHPVGTSPVMPGGIHLLNQLNSKTEDSRASVLWKSVSIKAEQILKDPAVEPVPMLTLTQLNRHRDQRPPVVNVDFTDKSSRIESMARWGNVSSFRRTSEGLSFISTGTKNWTSTGASVNTRLRGDFDVSAEYEISSIVIPPKGAGESVVYLQAIFYDRESTAFSLTQSGDVITSRIKRKDAKGRTRTIYLNKTELKKVTGLRLARRGNVVYCLATGGKPSQEVVLAGGRLSNNRADSTEARSTFLVQTRGEGRETHCTWKQVTIHNTGPAQAPVRRPELRRLPIPKGGA